MAEGVVLQKSFDFALQIIDLYREMVAQREYVLSRQMLRSGTSIGANVEEATAGQSRADFLSKMSIASKEARETRYWLRLIQASKIVHVDVATQLDSANELLRIFTAIVKTTGEQ